jgi:hypothetical protein
MATLWNTTQQGAVISTFFHNSWDSPSSLSVLEPYMLKMTKTVFTLAILAKFFGPFQKWNFLET